MMSSKPVVRVRVGTVLQQGQLDTECLQRYADARLKALTRSVAPFPCPAPGPRGHAQRRKAGRGATRAEQGPARQDLWAPCAAAADRGRPAGGVCVGG